MQNGWIGIGGNRRGSSPMAEFNLCVRAEPDPRYVFHFGGELECSPQIFQVRGSVKQAVFTCKFSLRNSADRNLGQRFRAIDVNNGSVFNFNRKGEAMLQSLNMTAHMYGDHVYHY